jgi:hypothetical protein
VLLKIYRSSFFLRPLRFVPPIAYTSWQIVPEGASTRRA